MSKMAPEFEQEKMFVFTCKSLLPCLGVILALIILITAPLMSVLAATPDGEKIGAGVIEAIRAEGNAYVIIALKEPTEMRASEMDMPKFKREIADMQQSALSHLSALEYRERHRYQAVPALAGTVTETGLAKLVADSNVVRIDLDVGGTGGLETSVPLINADKRHARGMTGDGVVVAVLDSGLDTDHADLADDLIHQECFLDFDGTINAVGRCPNGSDRQSGAGAAEDGRGHGTHVTGIITSRGTVSSVGVAPDANIVAIKILDDSPPSGRFNFFSEIVAALDFIINNRPDVDVINMSIVTYAMFAGDCDNATAFNRAGAAAINTLRANGVVAFASSGNNRSGTMMSSPACLSNVVSVGATDNTDNVASFTNSNASLDIMAPGVRIISTGLANRTRILSGTSMASPHAAGCAALLIDAGVATTPDEIEAFLETSPVEVTDPTNGLTFPSIDCGPSIDAYFLVTLGDINRDGSEDVAVLKHDAVAGTVTATVKDAEDDHLIQQVSFNPNRIPVAFKVMPDIDGNGAPELVVLGEDSVVVEIRDSLSGTLQTNVSFNPNNTPIDLAILADQNGNGIPELAVLGRSSIDDAVSVVVKDALTKQWLNYVGFNSNFTPLELAVLTDLNGNARVELAVLGVDATTAGHDKVQIRDSGTGAVLNNVFYSPTIQAKRLAVLPDQNANAIPELAVLREGRYVLVQINDALNDTLLNYVGYNPSFKYSQVLVIPDLNGNGVPEIGVLGTDPASGQTRVQINDAQTAVKISNVYFGKVFKPQGDVALVNDINGNGSAELVYLGKRESDGKLRVIIRDALTKAVINTVDF